MSEFTEQQPKDGETVLHCGHLEGQIHHFFQIGPEPTSFTRPDGTKGRANWIAICDSCFNQYALTPQACIRGDAQWKGNEPIIKNVLV